MRSILPFGHKRRFAGSKKAGILAAAVNSIEPLESRTLLQGVPALSVQISTSVARTVSFVDADGTHSSLTIAGPGAATVNFDGSGLVSNVIGKTIKITGTSPALDTITTTGTSAATRLTFKGHGGDKLVELNALTADASIGQIVGGNTSLSGSLSVAGNLRRLTLGPVTNSTITIGGTSADPAGSVALGAAVGSSVISGEPLGVVSARSFSASGAITAPSLKALNVKSDSSESVAIVGAIGAINAHGSLAGSISAASIRSIAATADGATIAVSGNLHAAVFRGDASGPVAADSADLLSARGNWTSSVAVTNRLGTMKVGGVFNASLSAGTAGLISVGQSIENSSLAFTTPFGGGVTSLKSLVVRQGITSSTMNASANVGSVAAGSIVGSTFYAGMSIASGLPATLADFAAQATIGKVKVKSTFNNSDIAAFHLGSVTLDGIVTSNSGTPFGLGADRIATLAGTTVGNEHFKLHQLHDPAALAQLIANSGLVFGDFTIALV